MKKRAHKKRKHAASAEPHNTGINLPSPASIQATYSTALGFYRAGNLSQAEKTLREILASDTDHPDSLHLLGLIAFQTGHLDAAVELINKAIEAEGQQAMYRGNLGLVLQALGRAGEAAEQFEQALSLQPDYAEAHMNLGNLLQSQGNVGDAMARYERAIGIKPEYAEAHMNLGNALHSLGRLDEAVASYERALTLRPNYAEAHMNLGNVLAALHRQDEAVTRYAKAISLQPGYAEAYLNRGNLLHGRGELREAIVDYERALAIRPDYAEAHMNLGIVLEALRMPEEAIKRYERALAILPNYAEAYMNLGNALQSINRWNEAILRYEQALAIRPAYAEAHGNLGIALDEMGRVDEAARQYEQALAIKPDYAEVHMNRSLNQLRRGEFSAGWAGHEWRPSTRPKFAQPQWHGEPLRGQRILIHGEQGLGDCIQFLRYLPLVQASGGAVMLEVPRGLLRLCSMLPGLDCLLATGESLPVFDWHCPLMSLPLAFATVVDTIPAQVPYLFSPREAQQKAAAFAWPTEGLRVGLVWAGNPKHARDQHRSIPFQLLAPLLHLAHIRLFSLQVGQTAEPSFAAADAMTDLSPAIADMADTAALIEKLDMVISVDTAVAHLAGALAKPVWILLAHQADWRWLTDREDSPWYPTAKLFRQIVAGDWKEVIDRVAAELCLLAGQHVRGC